MQGGVGSVSFPKILSDVKVSEVSPAKIYPIEIGVHEMDCLNALVSNARRLDGDGMGVFPEDAIMDIVGSSPQCDGICAFDY